MQESMDNLVEYGKQLDKDRAKRLRSESDSSSTTIDAAPSQSLPGAEPERKRKREDDEEDEDEDEDGEEIKQEWPPRTTTTPTTPPSELESGPRAVEKCWRCPEMFYVPVLDTDPRHMRKCVGWHHPGKSFFFFLQKSLFMFWLSGWPPFSRHNKHHIPVFATFVTPTRPPVSHLTSRHNTYGSY